ncbi:MAG: fibronectin type III domain-containing protein [Chitinispirillales bacterium]|jgi:uncharacterized protein (TIGR02145 family)|nr:fibronectin type III domain-containing protein [Chitinispirillales bacterium]
MGTKIKKRMFPAVCAVVVSAAAFAGGAVAQTYDSASVPFLVNVNATVSATDGAAQKQISVMANREATLRLPIANTIGVLMGARGQINASAKISCLNGKVTVSLPARSYRNADLLLYTVNGKMILRSNVSAANSVNNISRPNLATGVYLLSVRGAECNIATSRVTHNGGGLNIGVAFAGEEAASDKRLAKGAEAGDWTITVSAGGYIDSVYTLRPAVGNNARQKITLRTVPPTVPDVPANVTAMAKSKTSISVSWSEVSGATKYYVYRSATNGDDSNSYSLLATINTGWGLSAAISTTISHIDTGLSMGTTYYYKVAASNSVGEGAQSAYVFAVPRIITDILTDTRDNKTYKTVNIGSQTWMAENLNFENAGGSWCYADKADSCAKYGRLYEWDTAMTVCPSGWHLPTRQEWGDLAVFAGGTGNYGTSGTAGKALKSTSGWDGTDEFGFSALPGGNRDPDGNFGNAGSFGFWWTATENGGGNSADSRYMYDDYNSVYEGNSNYKSSGYSVRCVKNE